MDINKMLMEENVEDDFLTDNNGVNEKENKNTEKTIIDVKSLLESNINKNSVAMSFETLVSKFNDFHFVLPKYQRKYVWDREQIANLALSLIKNIPIPPIYVYFNEKDNKYVILDGQQRVISLFLYFNDLNIKRTKHGNKILVDFYELLKNSNDENDKLLDVIKVSEKHYTNATKYKVMENSQEVDITYSSLGKDAKRLLGSKYIEVVFLEIKSTEKEKVYSNIFKLLNSAGTPLKPQEIRNGVFQSSFYDKLHELNNSNETWRKLYGEKHETSRDVELLLRFIAVDYYTELDKEKKKIIFKKNKEGRDEYTGSYHLLLDNFSQKSISFTNSEIQNCITNLNTFFEKFNLEGSILENRRNKIVNHLLLEALYVAFVKLNKKIDEYNEDIIIAILSNDEYKNAAKNSTSNKANIEARLNVAFKEMQK